MTTGSFRPVCFLFPTKTAGCEVLGGLGCRSEMGTVPASSPTPILLLVRELGIGGCERDATKLALHIDRRRFAPHVGCFHEGFRVPELRAHGVPVVRFPVTSFGNRTVWKGARLFGSYVRENGICLVHSYDVPMNVFSAPVARWFRTPVVLTSQLSERRLEKTWVQRFLRFTDALSSRVVVNCEAMRELTEKDGVPAAKLFVCRNGYDPRLFHPPREGAPQWRPPGLEGASLVIGTICAVRTEKRVDLLVEAFARVKGERAGMKLLIVGSGPMLPAIREQAERLNISGDCLFEPARPDVAEWYRALDIFVLSSNTEAFPNALLEAMASGCAVISSRVGGTPEMIEDGERGFLFASENVESLTEKLRILIAREDLRRRFGAAAARFTLDNLTMAHYCLRMEALYEELLAGATGQTRMTGAA